MKTIFKKLKTVSAENRRGFTLIELMIVVAIIAVLAALSIVSFYGYRYRTVRAEAYASIGSIHSLQEAYAAEQNSYITAAWNPAVVPAGLAVAWPAGSYLQGIGFGLKGTIWYRYSAGAGSSWVASPVNGTVAANSAVNIVIQAEGDVDGDGITGQFFANDEVKTILSNSTGF